MLDKENILKLKHGEHWIVPECDYGKAEIWLINDVYLLFGIPMYGGNPYFVNTYFKKQIIEMIDEYNSWS